VQPKNRRPRRAAIAARSIANSRDRGARANGSRVANSPSGKRGGETDRERN
jgi:hypothetical protein